MPYTNRNRSFLAYIRYGEGYLSPCRFGEFTLHENATSQFDTRADQLDFSGDKDQGLPFYFRYTSKGYLLYARVETRGHASATFDGHGVFVRDNIACMHYVRDVDPTLFRLQLPEIVEEGREYSTRLTSVEHGRALGLEKYTFHAGRGRTTRRDFKADVDLLCLASQAAAVTLEIIKVNVPWRSEPNEA